jgi:hypothetical protein
MTDHYILIKSSEVSSTLRGLADSQETMEVLRIPSANVSAAVSEISNVSTEDYIVSANHTIKAGNISDSIVLPKEAINA